MTRRRLRNGLLVLAVGLLPLLPAPGWGAQGNPERGEALFVGSVAFAAGGAPCLACHGIAGHELGYAAGASYGPDLTALYTNYGAEGITAVLEDPAMFESMAAIFGDRPLREDEIADLTAFFAATADRNAIDVTAGLVGHVLLGMVLLLALFGALGWQRLKGVRRPLVERVRTGKGGNV